MKTLRIVSSDKISQQTKDVRYNDYRLSNWLGETQRWAWKGGDAMVVVTGNLPNSVIAYTVIRVGNVVKVLEGSLNQALRGMGFDPNTQFRVA
jgi:hypothetical protein